MDNFNDIVAPHLNAEAYRTDITGNYNVSYLDYIKIHSDGSILVGSSELTGRYWDGGASIYKDLEEAKTSNSTYGRCISLRNGTADGCFVDKYNKVLICEDNGAISIWGTTDEQQSWKLWKQDISVAEHDNGVLAVDCLDSGKEYVTVGADGNAKVWDINELICLRNYEAHTMPAVGVAVRPQSADSFATCSYDEHLSLWDKNIDKPALDLFKNDCGVRCIEWLDENRLLCGDEAGALRLLDVRHLDSVLTLTQFPTSVHKLVYSAKRDQFAVACDNSIVSVCEVIGDQCKVVYHDRHLHSGFVRDMAWDHKENNLLHSVGWDHNLITHTVL